MNCFPCFSSQKSKKEGSKKEHDSSFDDHIQSSVPEKKEASSNTAENGNIAAQAFNFRELAAATKNFRQECLLGEGGFGRVYKGTLQATGKVVAVKQLDRNSMEGNKEFLAEVGQLSLLQHPNLVNLIGYCADGDQRLLVYEFMPGGSLEDHLRDMKAGGKPLDWITRMKIAYGTAQGLEYLHEKANPPVIYRDLKSLNVLLDEQFNPKLSDIGLDKLGPSAEKMPMQSRMMDTYGYSAPEYSGSGTLTTMADVYSFGVVLLELITGRRPIDTTKPVDEQNLVAWAQPIFKEPKHFPEMADPLLKKRFPERGLNQAVAIAAMCVQDEAAARPLMSDLVTVLSFLSVATEENSIPPTLPPSISSKLHCISTKLQFMECGNATGKLKIQESSVNDSDSHSESDDDDDDEKSVSSTRSSSVNTDEESSLTHNHSRRSSDGSRFSQKSSGRSMFSISNDSRSAHDRSDPLSQKSSKKSHFSSSKESEDASFTSSDANLSSSDSSDESFSSSHEKSSRKLLDESGHHTSRKGSSRKSTDGRTVSVSDHKSSLKSHDGNDSLGHKSSRKLSDGSVSTSRKSSKIKSKDGKSSRKTPDGSLSLSSRKSHDETNISSASIRKSRRKSKKINNNDSLSRSSITGGPQDEN